MIGIREEGEENEGEAAHQAECHPDKRKLLLIERPPGTQMDL